ncbi:hypothetical protein G7Z17_g5783 [Cylindrodendrum hubeiense]|uniref:Azaphilone pigments biosynthesis cluster protein L N-terminal domain-containing protein n=1 Tax=Cylindrodendrum hubeiense TaxID=595255 RepID=A0A9P5LHH6_9HYPO|nr:hypothetical protein G7Z17_g5783 [Cylindrodendrum hubeiense]
MDPLSIAASAVALTQTAGAIASSLAGFVRSLQTADARVTALRDDLTQLTNFLQSVEKTLNGCRKYDFALIEDDLWQQSHVAMTDCKTTLSELAALVDKINDTTRPKGLVWKTRVVIDLSIHADEITSSRDKIQQSNWALQTVLHTMTVQLKASIDETFHASSRPAGGFERGLSHHPDSRIARNMRLLAKAAGHFYSAASSTASTTHGDRSVGHTPSYQSTAASILGDFPDSRRERVEQYLRDSRTLREPTGVSISSLSPPQWNSLARNSRPSSVLGPAMATVLARGSSNRSLDEDDVDAECERLYLDGLQDIATASMKNRDFQIAIEYLQRALEQEADSSSESPESRQRQIQLAFCYFFEGTWRLAEPIVTKLAESKAGQDLAVCSLLHALSLAYLQEYLFEDALAACKKALTGKKRLCNANEAEWQEYREALALLATIFHMEGDYIRAEVWRRQLPINFDYVHPANEVQYLQSKSSLFESILGDEDNPHQGGIAELDAGPNDVADGPSQGIARNGTVISSRGASLRAKVLELQRHEMDTMKEVIFTEPQSAIDAGDEASPLTSVKGSILRRRLSQFFGPKRIRQANTEQALAAVRIPESPKVDTASVAPLTPESQSPPEDGLWLKLTKSNTLLRKQPRARMMKFPTIKASTRKKKDFKLISMEKISYPPRQEYTHLYSPDDYTYVPSESDNMTPVAEYNESPPSTTATEMEPTDGPEGGPSSVSPLAPEELHATINTQTQVQMVELADEAIGTPSEPQNSPLSGPGNPQGARTDNNTHNSIPANQNNIPSEAHARAPLPTIPEDLENTLSDISTIMASLPTMTDADELHARKLELEVLLQRLKAMSDDHVLIHNIQRTTRDLEEKEALGDEEAHDSGYETMDDSNEREGPTPMEPSDGPRENSDPKSSCIKRAFSWTMGSESSYTGHDPQPQSGDDTGGSKHLPANPPWSNSYNAVALAFKRQNSEPIEEEEERQQVSGTRLEQGGIADLRNGENGPAAPSIARLEARASWDWERF